MIRLIICFSLSAQILIAQIALSQKIIIKDAVTIKTINQSSQKAYIGRTNLYQYQLQIFSKDSLWGTNIGTENGGIKCFSFSNDEQFVAFGTYSGYVEVWRIRPTERIEAKQLHEFQVNDIKFTEDDKFLVTADNSGIINVSLTLGLLHLKNLRVNTIVSTIELFPGNNNQLVSGDHNGKIIFWDIPTGKIIREQKAHESYIFDLEFDRNGAVLFSASHDKLIKMWDFEKFKLIRSFSGHEKAAFSIDVSKCGPFLVSGGMDHSVRLWNTLNGDMIHSFKGHSDYVMVVRFISDRTILSGSRDFTLRCWKF